MGLSRRYFLGMAAAMAALLRWPRAAAEQAPPGLSILQGMTDETTTQFSVVVPLPESYTINVMTLSSSAPAPAFSVQTRTRAGSDYGVLLIKWNNLQVGETYLLQIFNSKSELLDEREFGALDLSPRRVRLAIVSCAMDFLHRKNIWKQFYQQKPELAFFVGDSVYCDRKSITETVPLADPDMMWERYVATRNKVSFYFQKRLTPVLATWDDHDFGGDNTGGDNPYLVEAKDIFETFFAQDPRTTLESGPGIARKLSAFGCDFFLLDGRTFRDKPKSGGSLLGSQQEAWLAGALKPNSTWLLNGSVFFGAYGEFESFEGHYPEKFQELLELVRSKDSLAAFVSGDVHYSELMDIEASILGYGSFELVSSSIHSITFPSIHDRFYNPRRRQGAADSSHNFLIFEGEFGADKMTGEVICWGSSYDLFAGAVSLNR